MTNCVIPVEEPMKPLMMHEMEICFLAALREHFDLTQVTTKFLNGDLERSGKTVGVTSASFCRRCCLPTSRYFYIFWRWALYYWIEEMGKH